MAKSTGKHQSQKETYGTGGRKPLAVRVDEEVYNYIKKEAEKSGKNISWWVNDFFKNIL